MFYIDNAFDGQAWWCDVAECSRHERMDYSPGFKMRFSPSVLISTPNPKYGGENFYSFKTNDKGAAEILDRKKWVRRKD